MALAFPGRPSATGAPSVVVDSACKCCSVERRLVPRNHTAAREYEAWRLRARFWRMLLQQSSVSSISVSSHLAEGE